MRGVFLKPEVKSYRLFVRAAVRRARIKPMDGDLALTVNFYPPDKIRRDVDNVLKCLLDALMAASVFVDDYQVAEIHAYRRKPLRPHGMAEVTLDYIT